MVAGNDKVALKGEKIHFSTDVQQLLVSCVRVCSAMLLIIILPRFTRSGSLPAVRPRGLSARQNGASADSFGCKIYFILALLGLVWVKPVISPGFSILHSLTPRPGHIPRSKPFPSVAALDSTRDKIPACGVRDILPLGQPSLVLQLIDGACAYFSHAHTCTHMHTYTRNQSA